MGTIPEEWKSWHQKLEPSIHEKPARFVHCKPEERPANQHVEIHASLNGCKAVRDLAPNGTAEQGRPYATVTCVRVIPSEPNLKTRWVQPLYPIVERALTDYRDSLKNPQPTDVLYPGMVRTTNIEIIAKKAFIRANVEVWEPYNLRRSYGSDMFEMGIDPALYELYTGSNTKVRMKHYQIMHEGRIQRWLDSIFPDTQSQEVESKQNPPKTSDT